MEITIDQGKCIGAGQCVMAAPEVFDQRDDDGIVELLESSPNGPAADGARNAAALCPAAVISLRES